MSEFDEQWEEENYMNVYANRTEMSEFDKWVRDNFYAPYDVPTPDQAFEAGQQSQQAKIELLEVQLKGAEERAKLTLNHKNRMVGELQKQAITQGQNFNDLVQKLKDVEYFNQELQDQINKVSMCNEYFRSKLSELLSDN